MASIAIHSQQTPSSSTAALHRSPSLLGSIRSLKGTTISNIEPKCIAQASQVEIEFANLSNRYFALHISAPNGEKSETLEFSAYGQSKTFSPHQSGCGHGIWSFTLQCIDSKTQKQTTLKKRMYLDGVGSLFFTVDNQLSVRLSHQEFLRFPSATRQCMFNNGGTKCG